MYGFNFLSDNEMLKFINLYITSLSSRNKLFLIGSSMSGLNDGNSDIDLTIILPKLHKNAVNKALIKITQVIKMQFNLEVMFIKDTRIPIISFNYNDKKYDISINNGPALINTIYLSKLNIKIKDDIVMIKKTLKYGNLIDSKQGLFRSYDIALIYLYYLKILDILELQSINFCKTNSCDNINESFLKCPQDNYVVTSLNSIFPNNSRYDHDNTRLRYIFTQPNSGKNFHLYYNSTSKKEREKNFLFFLYNLIRKNNYLELKLVDTIDSLYIDHKCIDNCNVYIIDPFIKYSKPLHHCSKYHIRQLCLNLLKEKYPDDVSVCCS